MHTVTVRDVIDRYMQHSAATGLHVASARQERVYTLGLFSRQFGHLLVSDCRAFWLTDWIDSNERWKSLATKRQKANCVRAVFEWARKGERIDRNPFADVRYGEAERRPATSDEALSRLMSAASKPVERALRFLRLTGCRVSELCAATWADVDLERGVWTIRKHKSRKFTQRDKVVVLVPEAVALLVAESPAGARGKHAPANGVVELGVMPANANAQAVFLNSAGHRWHRVSLGAHIRRLRRKLGVEGTLHGIRHQFASVAIGAGASVKLVAEQLGHSSTQVTERYYWHRSDSMLGAIRDAVSLGQPKKGS